jgi:hypothetical protein
VAEENEAVVARAPSRAPASREVAVMIVPLSVGS